MSEINSGTTEAELRDREPESAVDWQSWVDSWDAQQAGYVADRESQFSLMFEVLERLDAAPGRLLDLACGTGTIADRAVRRFPGADVLALDADPFLIELGRRTLGDAVGWIEQDLREDDWAAGIADGSLDAVCSATALHWLEPPDVRLLARLLAAKLRPGGVFLNYDSLRLSTEDNPRLSELATRMRHEGAQHAEGVHDWASWWRAARAEPAFHELLSRRDRTFSSEHRPSGIQRHDMVDALRESGFAEVDTLGQVAERHLLAAIR